MRLHEKLIKELGEYHNAHVRLLSSRNGREPKNSIKKILRELRKTAKAMHLELLKIDRVKRESVAHQYMSKRKKKNEQHNGTDQESN
jgi:hypothetical protein